MVKKINLKTAGISLEGFQARAPASPAAASSSPVYGKPPNVKAAVDVEKPVKSFTGAGVFMSAITGKDEVSRELADVKSRLEAASKIADQFSGAELVRSLDPRSVRRSQWANRNSAEFLSGEFISLREEIRNAGGNTQPIKVRRVSGVVYGKPEEFEIVFGHRRHQACLEESLNVNAVVVDEMTDIELFEAMERENRGRKNLSGWEQGMMYQEALKKGLYSSARKLEEALNLNHSNCTRALQLAKLPEAVVRAFPSPLDLQVRWAKLLTDALQKDPDGMIATAKAIAKARTGLTPTEIFQRLIGKPANSASGEDIVVGGKKVAVFRLGPTGKAVIEFDAEALPRQKHDKLLEMIRALLAD